MITSRISKKPLHQSCHCLSSSCKTHDAAFTYNPRGELTRATQDASYGNNINQTLVQTSTGIWAVAFNADNRPIRFTKTEGDQTTLIECSYDYMGRRSMKKVTLNGTLTLHHRYIYRGYLQIACVDLTRSTHPALWLSMWDPSEPVATRPLAIQKNGTWFTYGHDLTKNVTELYNTAGGIATSYDYTPYGAVTAIGTDQPFQWSSEVFDAELGMVYYNYRHYNPMDGRWINRDPIGEEGGANILSFLDNNPINKFDILGLLSAEEIADCLIATVQVEKPTWGGFGMGEQIILTPGQGVTLKRFYHTMIVVYWKGGEKCCMVKKEYEKQKMRSILARLNELKADRSDENKSNDDLPLRCFPGNVTSATVWGPKNECEKRNPMAPKYESFGIVAVPISALTKPIGIRVTISVSSHDFFNENYYFNTK